jgi:hypothetical protein
MKTPLTLAHLGMIHEFGYPPHIPARPFLSLAIENNREQLQALNRELLLKLVHGDMQKSVALGKLGAVGQRLIQQQIRATLTPPNAPSTIKRKGSSHPLIDTGNMVQSVAWEIER